MRHEPRDVSAPLTLPSTPSHPAVDAETQVRAAEIVAAVARRFSLSPQEENVLKSAARGQSKKEIAYALGITVRTVEYYWTQVFKKLGCGSQIAVMALLFRCATGDPGIF